MKMRYDDETDWEEDQDEPEEEALFVEMRKVKYSKGLPMDYANKLNRT